MNIYRVDNNHGFLGIYRAESPEDALWCAAVEFGYPDTKGLFVAQIWEEEENE
jgi:hypothetical protein